MVCYNFHMDKNQIDINKGVVGMIFTNKEDESKINSDLKKNIIVII